MKERQNVFAYQTATECNELPGIISFILRKIEEGQAYIKKIKPTQLSINPVDKIQQIRFINLLIEFKNMFQRISQE